MQPGRSCPLHYRYSPAVFAREAEIRADTLYVIGGLYGNVPALHAVLALAAREIAPPVLVFNGDFNWFNIDDAAFRAINEGVLRHHALRGNVETELADDSDDASAGCGCAYPQWVGDAEVARSNAIMVMLRDTARRHAALRQRLAALPMHAVAQVGRERVAIVHGDLESLAGWSLAQESPFSSHEEKNIKNQILMSTCRIVACSHTCLPVARRMGDAVIINNGAAGMPNFRDTRFGVITRIATTPSPHAPLYGTRVGATHVDALALEYDRVLWLQQFLAQWPAGSAAHESYFRRITHGPAYGPDDANRLAVSNAATARPMVEADLATGKLS